MGRSLAFTCCVLLGGGKHLTPRWRLAFVRKQSSVAFFSVSFHFVFFNVSVVKCSIGGAFISSPCFSSVARVTFDFIGEFFITNSESIPFATVQQVKGVFQRWPPNLSFRTSQWPRLFFILNFWSTESINVTQLSWRLCRVHVFGHYYFSFSWVAIVILQGMDIV